MRQFLTKPTLITLAFFLYGPLGILNASSKTSNASIDASDREVNLKLARYHISNLVDKKSTRRYGTYGIDIRSSKGDIVYQKNALNSFKPASNLKLLITATSFEILSSSYRSKTYLYTDGEIKNGVLRGNLIVTGGADPVISGHFDKRQEDIVDAWGRIVLENGIREIEGEIILDNSFYWKNSSDLDKINVERFKPIRISTVASFRHASKKQLRKNMRRRIIRKKNGKRRVIYYYRRSHLKRTTFQPNYYFAKSLLKELKRLRVFNKKNNRVAILSEKPKYSEWNLLHVEYASTLSDIIKRINTYSDNFYADQLLRTIGYEVEGSGRIRIGADVIATCLADKMSVDTTNLNIADGSGLSHRNTVSPNTLIETMQYMHYNSAFYKDYLLSLSTPLGEGTMKNRIIHQRAEYLRAKTGTIRGVVSLSGYVVSRNNEVFYFTIINNRTRSSRAISRSIKRLENEICKILLDI